MARHCITEDDLTSWLARYSWNTFASSGGIRSNKHFDVSSTGIFRITDHGKITYEGADKSAAVAAYNKAP